LPQEHDNHDFQCTMTAQCNFFFLGDVWAHQSAFCHFSWGSNECIHSSSTANMW
jgi:hypothetical protein